MRAQIINTFAYYDLLELRGAGQLYQTGPDKSILEGHLLEYYGYVLTDKDYAEVDKKAKQLYDHYQAERRKLGLGNFDNSIPDEVKKFVSEK